MSLAREIFLYFLTDTDDKCYYYDNGQVKSAGLRFFNEIPYTPWLSQSPQGWLENTVAFGRSSRYYGINRSFVVPLKFVGDGASIIRTLYYTKKGIEQQISLVVLKWNDENDDYELYYKGELDLGKVEDLAAEGVQVSIMEGGIVKMLKSYENTVYEFPCDGSIPENKLIEIDGILFNDTFTYQVVESNDAAYDLYAVPVVFLNNTGDNVGITKGDQTEEGITDDIYLNYLLTSPNSAFKSQYATTATVKGKQSITGTNAGGETVSLYFATSDDTRYYIFNAQPITLGETFTADYEFTIPLTAGQSLFLIRDGDFSGRAMQNESEFTIQFTSKYPNSTTWAISAYDLFQMLVAKVGDNKYPADSTLLAAYPNLVLTSGDALRHTEKAVIKTSLADFFDSFNVVLNASLSNQTLPGQDESVFFESKEYVFDSSSVTVSLGEVSDLKISAAAEYIFNTLKIGYQPQSYDEKAGKQEYNTTAQYKAPITRLQKELTLVSKYRADSYGIEYTRFNAGGGKSTTNNASDNSVFILNIDPVSSAQQYDATRSTDITLANEAVQDLSFEAFSGLYFTPNITNDVFTFANSSAVSFQALASVIGSLTGIAGEKIIGRLYQNATVIETQDFTSSGGTEPFRLDFNSTIVLNNGDTVKIELETVGSSMGYICEVTSAALQLTSGSLSVYSLKRETYSTISGVDNPSTAYNIEQLTPARLVRTHGNWLRSVLHNQPSAKLSFQTSDKNKDLFTVKDGVTIKESSNVSVGSLDMPLFYPLMVSMKTKVPINYTDLQSAAANGHIAALYNGVPFYFFPIEVSQKPALNESQEWKGLMSPRTNLADLVNLDVDGLNFLNLMSYGMFIPHLCPVKFVPLDNILPSQYHTKYMDGWWFSEQCQNYIQQAKYFQPWQKDDVIELQCQTNGLGPVSVQIIDQNNNEIGSPISLSTEEVPAVKLPMILYQGSVPLNTLDEGLYYLLWTAGTGDTLTKWISEPLYVKEDWPRTVLIEYANDRNKQSVIFSNGYNPSIRVAASFSLQDFEPDAKFSVYEDQPADIELLNGIPFRNHTLFIGDDQGLPPWLIDKLSRITLLTSCNIDGLEFTRNTDAKFEKVSIPGWAMSYYAIKLREKNNRDGAYLLTDGTLDNNITVIYNINTTAFGTPDETVQITKVD